MIKAIIFDLGGVLISPEIEKMQNYVADYIGIPYSSFHNFFSKYQSDLTKGRISFIDVYSEMKSHFQIKNLSAQDILHEHLKIVQKIITNLNEEVLHVIEQLKQQYAVVCLVNTERDVVPLIRKRGIYDYFQKAYISTEVGMEKPDPKIYLTVLNDLHCKPQETIFIDDKENNLIPAKQLGMQTIQFISSEQLEEDLQKLHIL